MFAYKKSGFLEISEAETSDSWDMLFPDLKTQKSFLNEPFFERSEKGLFEKTTPLLLYDHFIFTTLDICVYHQNI